MKLANTRMFVITLTVVGLLTSVGIAIFLLLPTFRETSQLSDKIIRAHSELEAQYLNRKSLLTSADKIKAVRETMSSLSGQFAPPDRELDFITTVEEIASRSGVEERLLLSVNENGKGVAEVRVGFDLTLSGPWHSVLQTLVEIERIPTLIIFDTAVARPGKGELDGPSFLSINLHGSLVSPPSVL